MTMYSSLLFMLLIIPCALFYFMFVADNNTKKELRKDCINDAKCSKDQGCSNNGKCVCKNGMKLYNYSVCQEECVNNNDCSSTLLECKKSKCVCRKDSSRVWDWRHQKCRGCYGSYECREYDVCLNGTCKCYDKFYWLSTSSCGACTGDDDCGENRICLDEEVSIPRKCICKSGYYWLSTKKLCKDISCADNPCGGVSKCIDEQYNEQKFRCVCPDGQFGDGYHCYDTPCYNSTCHNGGTCFKNNKKSKGFICLCPIGFSGRKCQLSVKPGECTEVDCKNGGQCDSQHKCACKKGFTGNFCEDMNCKAEKDCFNNGHCAGGTCHCSSNYTGVFCEADVSTVNNDIRNWNASVDPLLRPPEPSWNPKGTGIWRIQNARVTASCDLDRICKNTSDRIIHANVKDRSHRASAKLVDFDVELQVVSKIYGWTIEVENFFKGDFQSVPFQYMWTRYRVDDNKHYGAVYQSVLHNVQFGYRADESDIVKFFKRNVDNNDIKLSIHFNIDQFVTDSQQNNFTIARIVGSIGISGPKSPPYFTLGRLLEPVYNSSCNYSVWYAPFVKEKKDNDHYVLVDFGNSFQIDSKGNVTENIGQLRFGLLEKSSSQPTCADIKASTWFGPEWNLKSYNYTNTTGIIDMKIDKLVFDLLDENRLVLMKLNSDSHCSCIVLAEAIGGLAVHPLTQWTLRSDGNSTLKTSLRMTQFGKTKCDKDLIVVEQDDSYTMGPFLPRTPAISKATVKCSKDNNLEVSFETPTSVNNPRHFIDGQVYTFQYYFKEIGKINASNEKFKSLNSMIALFVYSNYKIPTNPCWLRHVGPIFQQYATLYPVMKTHFFDMGDYYEVVANKRGLIRSMELDEEDPHYMPVTRDLSKPKRQMILNWLAQEKPCYGVLNFAVNVQMLKQLLQTALKLEHSTIPPYLSGYFSLKKSENSQVREMVKGILISEMHHMALVANVINAIGGHPDLLAPDFVPSYPSYLPGGVHPQHKISVNKMSTTQIRNAYMVIEQPTKELQEGGLMDAINRLIDEKQDQTVGKASKTSKTEQCEKGDTKCGSIHDKSSYYAFSGKLACDAVNEIFVSIFGNAYGFVKNHNTIGELYAKILMILSKLECERKIEYLENVPQVEVRDEVFKVDSYVSAVRAIERIVSEGEGASACNPLDDKTELSHYYKFGSILNRRHIKTFVKNNTNQIAYDHIHHFDVEEIKHCQGTFAYTGRFLPFNEDGVWPIVPDPKMTMYKEGSRARYLATQFNNTYFELLTTIQQVFDATDYQKTFIDSFGIMKQLLVIGDKLVQVPIKDGGDPNIGPNAGPIYPSYP
ncbi:uncharacterized protein LOC124448267 isoform X3 [Xenia sp. Carnegie-2017]|uniref:uncharacterized protein LOC124448267 isoform X3 n=1 Tax=Xenia sp. Carnegie-2017 TaxID=2897299 RepID=UPI001F03B9AC|nr:uncharacterized protein LOC124448267 isoform X3 [Xenia sp. Carnegie-2017]